MPIPTGLDRPVAAIADRSCRLRVASPARLHALAAVEPGLEAALTRLVTLNLWTTLQLIAMLRRQDPVQRIAALLVILAGAGAANAAITWTDWTSAAAAGVAGTMGSIGVTGTTDTGGFHNRQIAGGFDDWRQGGVTPWAAHDALPNLPANDDFVAPNTGSYTFTFSKPVVGLTMAIISLGQPQVQTVWTFDRSFTLVDQGKGYWGNGVFTIAGNSIGSGEGHGVIRFDGLASSLPLRSTNGEFWSGFSLGHESVAAIPEPATRALLIAGFGLVGASARRRRLARATA